jgi:hypothetical protein
LEVVDQIVAAGDAGEKVVDLGGALFAGDVKGVAHTGSLAQWREPKSKPQKFCFARRTRFVKVEIIGNQRKANRGLF